MLVSSTLKPMRASLTSGNGVEGRFESYSTPLPVISLWTRKGNEFGWVRKCGRGSLGWRPSLRDKSLLVGSDGCVLQDESQVASMAVSTGLVGFTRRACTT